MSFPFPSILNAWPQLFSGSGFPDPGQHLGAVLCSLSLDRLSRSSLALRPSSCPLPGTEKKKKSFGVRNTLYFLTLSGRSKKANQGPTQGYLANPCLEEGGGVSGRRSEARRAGQLDLANPLMATVQGRSLSSDGQGPWPMGRTGLQN